MDKVPNNGGYVAPEINVIEIQSQGVSCASEYSVGNGGYNHEQYEWGW